MMLYFQKLPCLRIPRTSIRISHSLDIANGLKELLIKYEFTLELLSTIPPSELAKILGIDEYIAKVICTFARKLAAT
jgi:hypothetical protein